jgi:hypothetical protein
MADLLSIRFEPSRIVSTQGIAERGYRAYIDLPGQGGYDGLVDYEARVSPLDLSSLRSFRGQWRVHKGILEVGPGLAIPSGIYMTRVKPAGAADSSFGPFEIILVDDRPIFNAGLQPSSQSLRMPPPPGSSMVFENLDAGGRRMGYTRVDVETEPGILGGSTLRFTKSHRDCYWQPGENWNLRWVIRHRSTPWGRMLVSPGGEIYRSPWPGLGSDRLNVSHPGNRLDMPDRQGLLGGFGDHPARRQLDVYQQPADMWLFYALLPPGDRLPLGLSAQPQTVVDLAFGRPNPGIDIDLWHAAALAPSRPDAALRMRYAEAGAKLLSDRVQLGWSVVEDWDWRADGLIERIVQYKNVPTLHWRRGVDGADPSRLSADMRLVEWQIPDARPLRITLWDPVESKGGNVLDLETGGLYHMIVHRADGQPYSGFLEVEVQSLRVDGEWRNMQPGSRGLWRDREGKPIYISDGVVAVGGAAHGNPVNWGVVLRARPYLANASINALYPARDEALIPNASAADFSESLTLTFGLPGFPRV